MHLSLNNCEVLANENFQTCHKSLDFLRIIFVIKIFTEKKRCAQETRSKKECMTLFDVKRLKSFKDSCSFVFVAVLPNFETVEKLEIERVW